MNVPVVGCLKQYMAFRRQIKREKVVVGPGSKEYIARYETSNCRELRVRWRGLVCRWQVGHGHVSRGVLQTENGLQKRE